MSCQIDGVTRAVGSPDTIAFMYVWSASESRYEAYENISYGVDWARSLNL
jgi:hypothetical protein